MEQLMIDLMENILTDKDRTFINGLESKFEIDDDMYDMMNDIKLYFFKKGFKSAISVINYCDK